MKTITETDKKLPETVEWNVCNYIPEEPVISFGLNLYLYFPIMPILVLRRAEKTTKLIVASW